jgi:hypothetical protein
MKFDISSTTIEKGIDVAKRFLQTLIGPSVEEIGLLYADKVKLWRLKNQVKVLRKAEEYVRRKNISTKQISLKALVPLLDGASLEEVESLHDKWSALLVNYIDSNKNLTSTVYPYILSQISTNELEVLDYCLDTGEVSYSDLFKTHKVSEAEISNLMRLGLLREFLIVPNHHEMDYIQTLYINEISSYALTGLGVNFLEACKV